MMDTVEGEAPSYAADCFAMMILIYLHLTVSVEMSRLRRSNEILLMATNERIKKIIGNEIKAGIEAGCRTYN